MLTNEERREIAIRLRRKEPSSFETVFDVFTEIGLAVNPKGGSFKTLPLQLADLIESEPERTCTITYAVFNEGDPTGEYESWNCSHCGELPYDDADSFSYCPCCGTKVIQDVNE